MAVRIQQLKAELEARLAEEARIDAEQQQYGAEMEALEKQIAEVNARIATKTKTKTKRKTSGGGGRRGSVEVLDLAPLRDGGCKARSWNKGQGTQCPRQAMDGQFYCKGCQGKANANCLPCGDYDEPRPSYWHETPLGANSATKVKEDKRKGMPWKMDAETYQRQFATIFGEKDAEEGAGVGLELLPQTPNFEADRQSSHASTLSLPVEPPADPVAECVEFLVSAVAGETSARIKVDASKSPSVAEVNDVVCQYAITADEESDDEFGDQLDAITTEMDKVSVQMDAFASCSD